MSTLGWHHIRLRPYDTTNEDIFIEQEWILNDIPLFKKAIRAMKDYRLREERAF